MSVFPSHLKQRQSGGVQSRQGLSTEEVNGGSNGHCLALRRPSDTSHFRRGPTWLRHDHLWPEPLLVSLESPQDAEQQQGQKKGKAGKSRTPGSHNAKGKGTLPTSTSRCSSQTAAGWASTMPHLSVTHQAAPFNPDSSPPPESQPREHKQWIMVPGLGSKHFLTKWETW